MKKILHWLDYHPKCALGILAALWVICGGVEKCVR